MFCNLSGFMGFTKSASNGHWSSTFGCTEAAMATAGARGLRPLCPGPDAVDLVAGPTDDLGYPWVKLCPFGTSNRPFRPALGYVDEVKPR